MPELPDVELYKQHLDATCLGRTIRQVAVSDAWILADVSTAELRTASPVLRSPRLADMASIFWSISDHRAS
jgi:formamidopyrimidine-DNA glycosylase